MSRRDPDIPREVPGQQPGAQPVDVRLMGEDGAVRRLVAALAVTGLCGPASYRPMRDSTGTRAYLTVIVPAEENPK
ncbi:hypothetical protein KV557_24640 [Kitasatospora aureofaciens]|uniref:hypothetical protein n=1 Tax=Kitasatospora aureofaciens TaxID=1894 RepID=UPI001C461F5F|nr:hypothetical protein [Kitasatospora aureofaciens]MBV6700253.1 hypothetical protein [Kitasatospora aureofaciens]